MPVCLYTVEENGMGTATTSECAHSYGCVSCVVVCCSVLQWVAVGCSELQWLAVDYSGLSVFTAMGVSLVAPSLFVHLSPLHSLPLSPCSMVFLSAIVHVYVPMCQACSLSLSSTPSLLPSLSLRLSRTGLLSFILVYICTLFLYFPTYFLIPLPFYTGKKQRPDQRDGGGQVGVEGFFRVCVRLCARGAQGEGGEGGREIDIESVCVYVSKGGVVKERGIENKKEKEKENKCERREKKMETD